MTKLRIVFNTDPETEYTVQCDAWSYDHEVIHTWDGVRALKYNNQFFVLTNIQRWADLGESS